MVNTKDYVVLLHGFWRTAKSMHKIEEVLLRKGYRTVNLDYSSREDKIEKLSNSYSKKPFCRYPELRIITCLNYTQNMILFIKAIAGALIVRITSWLG